MQQQEKDLRAFIYEGRIHASEDMIEQLNDEFKRTNEWPTTMEVVKAEPHILDLLEEIWCAQPMERKVA